MSGVVSSYRFVVSDATLLTGDHSCIYRAGDCLRPLGTLYFSNLALHTLGTYSKPVATVRMPYQYSLVKFGLGAMSPPTLKSNVLTSLEIA